MAGRPTRARFWVESAVALVCALLFIGTLLVPDWAEILFRIDPDEGNGSVEWLVTVLVAATALVALVAAGLEWRARTRLAADRTSIRSDERA
jgi:hypothetical protein